LDGWPRFRLLDSIYPQRRDALVACILDGDYEHAAALYWDLLYFTGTSELWTDRAFLSDRLLEMSRQRNDHETTGLILAKGQAWPLLYQEHFRSARTLLEQALESFVRARATAGIARARQTGLEAARGRIVVSTDADTLHHTGWLSRIVSAMRDERVRCGAGMLRSLSRRRMVRASQDYIAWTMRVKNSISPRLVTGVSEANSFYFRELALAVGGYDTRVRVGMGMLLFRKMHLAGAPLIFTDEELVIFTSGRRIEREGAARWLGLGMWNTTAQLVGSLGIGKDVYPDVR